MVTQTYQARTISDKNNRLDISSRSTERRRRRRRSQAAKPRLVNTRSKLSEIQTLSSLREIVHSNAQKLALKLATDSTHQLQSQYVSLPSGRSHYLLKRRSNRYRYKHSSVLTKLCSATEQKPARGQVYRVAGA